MKKIFISLGFVIGLAAVTQFFVTQKFSNQTSSDSQGRQVANLGERNSTEQIRWEQKVAEELSAQSLQSSLRPNSQDQLVYEYFMGQYNVNVENGLIKKLVLQDNMNGVNFETESFLKQYGQVLKPYAKYSIIENAGSGSEEIRLFNQAGERSGTLFIQRNEQGRVTEVSVE